MRRKSLYIVIEYIFEQMYVCTFQFFLFELLHQLLPAFDFELDGLENLVEWVYDAQDTKLIQD